jgi:heme A synthase
MAYASHNGTRGATTMTATTVRQKVGLVLAGVYSVGNIPSAFMPTLGIMIIGSVLAVVGLVAVVMAWRTGSRVALRVAAGAIIVITLTGLPAFFVDVPAWVKLLVGVSTILTIVTVVLLLSPSRRPVVTPAGSPS